MRVTVEFDQATTQAPVAKSAVPAVPASPNLSALTEAMNRMLELMAKRPAQGNPGLVEAIRGLRKDLSSLPDTLLESLDAQFNRILQQKPGPTNVTLPKGMLAKLDSMESALIAGLQRVRPKTFGSTY